MKPSDAKAVRLVAEHRVEIAAASFDALIGRVRGDHSTYTVTIDPLGAHCTCRHGQERPGRASCSHVKALELEELRLSEGVDV